MKSYLSVTSIKTDNLKGSVEKFVTVMIASCIKMHIHIDWFWGDFNKALC